MIYPYAEKQTVLDTPLAKGHLLATSNERELVLLVLEPNGEVPFHALPIHVTFFVKKGSGLLKINEHSFEATEGDILEVAAYDERSWLNNGSNVLELLVIKAIK